MNREQYLAKRMWLHGASFDPGGFAETRHPADREVSTLPAASLSDYYRRFHQAAAPGKNGNEKPN